MKFRKKPLIVEAEQWFPFTDVAGVVWGEYWDFEQGILKQGAILRTLEGTFEVTDGDWIVTGVKGEKWPVKDEIFRESYEEVDETVRT
jgi:hypothetical protein